MSFLGSLGSSLFGTVTSALAGHWSAKQNAGLARQNWSYAQSNAHQLESQDLAKAGLNPILSASNSQIAGMGAVSGNSVSDNGLGAAATNASVSKYLKGIDAEIEGKKLDNDLKRIEIENKNLELRKWLSEHEAKNLDADTNMKDSQTSVNNAQVGYLNQQTASLRDLTEVQVKQITQDIQNSIEITRATVDKYGAESEAARAVAAESYGRLQLVLEQVTGQRLDNQQMQRILDNPKAELDADTWNFVKKSTLWSGIYSLGQYIKSISPFGTASVGYHQSNQNRTSTSVRTSTIDHNYNRK